MAGGRDDEDSRGDSAADASMSAYSNSSDGVGQAVDGDGQDEVRAVECPVGGCSGWKSNKRARLVGGRAHQDDAFDSNEWLDGSSSMDDDEDEGESEVVVQVRSGGEGHDGRGRRRASRAGGGEQSSEGEAGEAWLSEHGDTDTRMRPDSSSGSSTTSTSR